MARLRKAKDGHFYITHGYPVLRPDGRADSAFATYQLFPRAERLMEQAPVEDGSSISRETFYALLTDGDIYNNARPNGIPIAFVPGQTRAKAEEVGEYCGQLQRQNPGQTSPKYLIDVFQIFKEDISTLPKEVMRVATAYLDTANLPLSAASWYCLLRRIRARP